MIFQIYIFLYIVFSILNLKTEYLKKLNKNSKKEKIWD